jgi:glutaminyl-peptide cyclotransferase
MNNFQQKGDTPGRPSRGRGTGRSGPASGGRLWRRLLQAVLVLAALSACGGQPSQSDGHALGAEFRSPPATGVAQHQESPLAAPPAPITPPEPVLSPGSAPGELPSPAAGTATILGTLPNGSTGSKAQAGGGVPVYTYNVNNVFPHDRQASTQGLVYEDGFLYESTGLHGRSSLRQVELETGNILQFHALPDDYFGEGLTLYGDRLIQLTWFSRLGFVYDKESFALLRTFAYPTEGWGLTHDGQRLIMSDGSATLYFLDPDTLTQVGLVPVTVGGMPVTGLNELEYIQGSVYANIWRTDRVARIDPGSGEITAWIDLSGLLGPEDLDQPVGVLNGIAYDPEGERLFVTGKLWPKIFEIELVPPAHSFLPIVEREAG